MNIVVLGGTGIIGRVTVKDLVETTTDTIIIAATDEKRAKEYAATFRSSRVQGIGIDVTNIDATARVLRGAGVCVNCVLYYYNIHVMQACLRAGVHYLDLGGLFHMTRKQLRLHKEFKKKGIVGVVGCGSTPGITNVMAAYGAQFFDKVNEIHISFADKDFTKYNQPFVLPYTMYTLFDEFMLQSAVLKRGKIKMVAPMSGKNMLSFPKPVGRVAGFYTLHSELATFPRSFGLHECSFRVTFPEEFRKVIELLITLGFASDKSIEVKGYHIKPRDVTARVMDRWLPKDETRVDDIEYVRVELHGVVKNKKKTMIVDAMTRSRKDLNVSAGVYDTAVPPSVIAQMIVRGKVVARGVMAPEKCIEPKIFFKELRTRGISIKKAVRGS